MSKTLALVASGPTRPEIFSKLPRLAKQLGPVKAPTLQQASRVCSAIGAGRPVADWPALSTSLVLLVTVPEEDRAAVAVEIAAIDRSWKGVLVVFAGGPGIPASLEEKGIAAATVTVLDDAGRSRFLVAGDARAARLIRAAGGQVTMVPSIDAAAYRGAMRVLCEGVPALVESAAGSLRSAGLPVADARAIVEAEVDAALRLYFRTRRRPVVPEKLAEYAALVAREEGG